MYIINTAVKFSFPSIIKANITEGSICQLKLKIDEFKKLDDKKN
jgi:hypothetical protein